MQPDALPGAAANPAQGAAIPGTASSAGSLDDAMAELPATPGNGVRSLHRPGRKYPHLFQQEIDGRLHTWVANQLLLTVEDPESLERVEEALAAMSGIQLRKLTDRTYVVSWTSPDIATFEAMERRLAELGGSAVIVEKDSIVQARVVPQDPLYASQSHYDQVAAPEGWAIRADASGIVVAVLDSGLEQGHPDLQGVLVVNQAEIPGNGVDDDNNGKVDDVAGWDFVDDDNDPEDLHGHGTAMVGAIGARWNSIGITGMANGVAILPLRFLDEDGFGSNSDEIAALEYVLERGVDILNASYGGPSSSVALRNQYERLAQAGIWVVAAAGNESSDTDRIKNYPSSYEFPNIISVGAAAGLQAGGSDGAVAGFSNYGRTSVDLFAPGVAILSTGLGGGYRSSTGSSIAAALVSGALALVLAEFPDAEAGAIRDRIISHTRYVSGVETRCVSAGVLDLGHSLSPGDPRPPTVLSPPEVRVFNAGDAVQLSVDFTAYEAPAFQWFLNGVEIAGAIGRTYSIQAQDKSIEGVYTVRITTSSGSVLGTIATIHLHAAPPFIIHQPRAVILQAGVQTTLQIKASGSDPLVFQWFRDSQPLAGANNDSYTVRAAGEADQGVYTVTVSNRFGSVTSDPIHVSLDASPMIAWRLLNAAVLGKVMDPFSKAGDFHWSPRQGWHTADFLTWHRTDPRLVFPPVYTNGHYWAVADSRVLLRSVDGINWDTVEPFQFPDRVTFTNGSVVAGNGLLLVRLDHEYDDFGRRWRRYQRIDTESMESAILNAPVDTHAFLFDGAHFWISEDQSHFRSGDGVSWSSVDLGGRLLVHCDIASGYYVTRRYVDFNWVFERSKDLVTWHPLPGGNYNRFGDGTASTPSTTVVLATGEVRQVSSGGWNAVLYENTRHRLLRLKNTLTLIDLISGERIECLHQESFPGDPLVVGGSVYIPLSSEYYLWTPDGGLRRVEIRPEGVSYSWKTLQTANGYGIFTGRTGLLYRLKDGDLHIEQLAVPASSSGISASNNLFYCTTQGQVTWSLDGSEWHPSPNWHLLHRNGVVLNLIEPGSDNDHHAVVMRWNAAGAVWEEVSRLPAPQAQPRISMRLAVNSGLFCVALGSSVHFSADGSDWFPGNFPEDQIQHLEVRQDHFVFSTNRELNSVTRDGSAWSMLDRNLLPLAQSDTLSFGLYSRIARSDGSAFPQSPITAIEGSRSRTAPAAWNIVVSPDQEDSLLRTELWINGILAGVTTEIPASFEVRQELPALLSCEVKVVYPGNLILSSGAFSLTANAQVRSEVNHVLRGESGEPLIAAPPGINYYPFGQSVIAYDPVGNGIFTSSDGKAWAPMSMVQFVGPGFLQPNYFTGGSLFIPFNRPLLSPSVDKIGVLITAGGAETLDISYPRDLRAEADYFSIANRAFMLFVDGKLLELTHEGAWIEHPGMAIPRPADGSYPAPERHYRIHKQNGIILFETFADGRFFASDNLVNLHEIAVPPGWTHFRNHRFRSPDGIHSAWLVSVDGQFTDPLQLPFSDAQWGPLDTDTYSLVKNNLLWIATRDGRVLPFDTGMQWIQFAITPSTVNLLHLNDQLLAVSDTGEVRSIVQHEVFPSHVEWLQTVYGRENRLQLGFFINSGGLFDFGADSVVEAAVVLRPAGDAGEAVSLGIHPVPVTGLRPFESMPVVLEVPVPSDLLLGEFIVSVELDPNDDYEELDEGNNTALSETFVYSRDVPLVFEVVGDGWLESNTVDSSVPFGRQVAVDAMADPGSTFVSWSGSLRAKEPSVHLVAERPMRLRAHFVAKPLIAVFPDLQPDSEGIRYREDGGPAIQPVTRNWGYIDSRRWAFFPELSLDGPRGLMYDTQHGWLRRVASTPWFYSFNEGCWLRYDAEAAHLKHFR